MSEQERTVTAIGTAIDLMAGLPAAFHVSIVLPGGHEIPLGVVPAGHRIRLELDGAASGVVRLVDDTAEVDAVKRLADVAKQAEAPRP